MTDRDLQQKRMVAAAIDIGIAIAISVVFMVLSGGATFALGRGTDSSTAAMIVPRLLGFIGSVIGLGYVLGRDMLAGGRSIGKQVQGLRLVTTSGMPITFMDSARRNALFAIGSALGLVAATLQLIPCLGDAVACLLSPLIFLGGLVSLGIAIFEMVKITQDPEGIRMGDQMAGTRVIR